MEATHDRRRRSLGRTVKSNAWILPRNLVHSIAHGATIICKMPRTRERMGWPLNKGVIDYQTIGSSYIGLEESTNTLHIFLCVFCFRNNIVIFEIMWKIGGKRMMLFVRVKRWNFLNVLLFYHLGPFAWLDFVSWVKNTAFLIRGAPDIRPFLIAGYPVSFDNLTSLITIHNESWSGQDHDLPTVLQNYWGRIKSNFLRRNVHDFDEIFIHFWPTKLTEPKADISHFWELQILIKLTVD